MRYEFDINPVTKPRMTSSDKWNKRTCTSKYWGFKNEFKLKANLQGLKDLPIQIMSMEFHIEMPNSWSLKKKQEFNGQLHCTTPDLDNILKGIFDALCTNDKHIASIGNLVKYWTTEGQGKIIIETF